MIKDFHIHNFRGIKDFEIKDLNQINVFLGYNNCGKTSVLDAILLFSGATNPRLPITINWARQYNPQTDEQLKVNFYGMNTDTPIFLKGTYEGRKTRHLEISYSEKENANMMLEDNPNEADRFYYLNLKANICDTTYLTSIKFPGKNGKLNTAKVSGISQDKYEEELKCLYISSLDPFNLKNNVDFFSRLLVDKQEKSIIDNLKLIEPNLKDIIIVGNELYADVGLEKRIPIQVLGDGIRKIISILFHMYEAKNGILLIDEIDNGLHFKSMPILWKSIFMMAKDLNVQLFATTHNIDSINALNNILADDIYCKDMQEKAGIFTLRKLNDGSLVSLKNSFTEFNHLLNQDIEIR